MGVYRLVCSNPDCRDWIGFLRTHSLLARVRSLSVDILFNLFLSMLAAIQAPIILLSQNRSAQKDRIGTEHDYEVNLKAELEIVLLHDKLDLLREAQ